MIKSKKLKFVRALLKHKFAYLGTNGKFDIQGAKSKASLDENYVAQLVADGIVERQGAACEASAQARNWVKRQLLGPKDFAGQHREIKFGKDHVQINLCEGAIAQLSVGRNGASPFMEKHHIETANKIQFLVERAQMRQRTTMSYDPSRLGSKMASRTAGPQLGDSAIDARRALRACFESMPDDLAGVVLDVCGFQKGLQLVESERKWPRRSAKLLLRVGLEQAAAHFGIMQQATGVRTNKNHHWLQTGFRASQF